MPTDPQRRQDGLLRNISILRSVQRYSSYTVGGFLAAHVSSALIVPSLTFSTTGVASDFFSLVHNYFIDNGGKLILFYVPAFVHIACGVGIKYFTIKRNKLKKLKESETPNTHETEEFKSGPEKDLEMGDDDSILPPIETEKKRPILPLRMLNTLLFNKTEYLIFPYLLTHIKKYANLIGIQLSNLPYLITKRNTPVSLFNLNMLLLLINYHIIKGLKTRYFIKQLRWLSIPYYITITNGLFFLGTLRYVFSEHSDLDFLISLQ